MDAFLGWVKEMSRGWKADFRSQKGANLYEMTTLGAHVISKDYNSIMPELQRLSKSGEWPSDGTRTLQCQEGQYLGRADNTLHPGSVIFMSNAGYQVLTPCSRNRRLCLMGRGFAYRRYVESEIPWVKAEIKTSSALPP